MSRISSGKLVIVFVLVLGVAVTVAAILLTQWEEADLHSGSGWVLVEDYRHLRSGEALCDALIPECGYCPGEVRDERCYVRQENIIDDEWILVHDYRHVEPNEPTCMALIPSCGYCPGEVRNRKCYVRRGVGYDYFDINRYLEDEWTRVESYRHVELGDITCDALMPECGYCPGEVRGKECYIQCNAEYDYWSAGEYCSE
jgi:hypothetical protein